MNRSITQMSKKELLEIVRARDSTIEHLLKHIEGLESMAIVSSATPLESDISTMLETLAKRVRELEGKQND